MLRGIGLGVLFALASAAPGCGGSPPAFVPPREASQASPSPSPSLAADVPVATSTATPSPSLSPAPTPTPDSPAPGLVCDWVPVVSVTDGDTLTVRLADGSRQPVRLIGVDAPEGGQPFAPEAAALLARLAADRVCLEIDITDRDRFNRLLRYAWTQDGVLINEALVAAGLATVVTFPPDVKHLESRYLPAETSARAAGLGIWAAAASSQAASPAASGECDPSYPDVCIPPPSKVGDLDCGDIPYRRFRVLPPDPHRFDSDRDGIGCER